MTKTNEVGITDIVTINLNVLATFMKHGIGNKLNSTSIASVNKVHLLR